MEKFPDQETLLDSVLEFDSTDNPYSSDEQNSANTIYSLMNSRVESSEQLFREIDNKIWNELSMSDSIREAVRKEKFQEKNNKRTSSTSTSESKNILSLSDPVPPISSAIKCKFFSSGSCKNGTHCPYVHTAEDSTPITSSIPTTTSPLPFKMEFEDKSKRPICKFYLMGNGACKKGDQCQFRHELENTNNVPAPAPPPPKNITFEPSEWPSLPATATTTTTTTTPPTITPSVSSSTTTTAAPKKPSTMASVLLSNTTSTQPTISPSHNVTTTTMPSSALSYSANNNSVSTSSNLASSIDKPYIKVKEFHFSNTSNNTTNTATTSSDSKIDVSRKDIAEKKYIFHNYNNLNITGITKKLRKAKVIVSIVLVLQQQYLLSSNNNNNHNLLNVRNHIQLVATLELLI